MLQWLTDSLKLIVRSGEYLVSAFFILIRQLIYAVDRKILFLFLVFFLVVVKIYLAARISK